MDVPMPLSRDAPAARGGPAARRQRRFSGALLRRRREELGLSQRALAARAGTSPGTVGRLEQGRARAPHLATIRRLAAALGVAPERLVAWAGAAPAAARPP